MSLDKAIKHGCCDWCKGNRLHKNKVREMKYKEEQ